MQAKDVFSVKEAAEYLAVHEDTVRKEIAQGHLAAAKVGRQYRIRKTDLDQLFKPQREEQPQRKQ